MDIKIENYLSEEEVKEIVKDELRSQIRSFFKDEETAQRLISNLSYQIVFDEVDKIVPNSKQKIVDMTNKLINEKETAFYIFRTDDYGGRKSLAIEYIEDAVKSNKDLLNQKVKDTIESKDYSDEIWNKFEELGENFMSNIYSIVELGRSKKQD